MGKKAPEKNRKRGWLVPVLCSLFLLLSFIVFFSTAWYLKTYGKMGFDAVIFTLSNLQGAAAGLVWDYISYALVLAGGASLCLCLLFWLRPRCALTVEFFRRRKITLFPLARKLSVTLSLILSVGMLGYCAVTSGLLEYIHMMTNDPGFIEQEYVDPADVDIQFPEKKRNLIYIYMESMETSFLSRELGGTLDYNVIPELYSLAHENVNFSENDDVGGFQPMTGMTFTVGGMVAQSAGVPLKIPPGVYVNSYGTEDHFLPGIITLSDILHEQGYYQAAMFGSEARFGGRKYLLMNHGTDTIYDYHTAMKDGTIPVGYMVWWGFEDAKLFPYAKEKLLEIAEKDQPFAFTMLTADTHHVDGYLCEDCRNDYPEQYENVYACSSRRVAEFVQWIQQQDFYENTTIVLCGDHCSMDQGFFDRNADPGYVRRVYNCIINPNTQVKNEKNRIFTTTDLFPTTLAAMGCRIPGERLGLGTNLFSGEPTLSEQYGHDYVDSMLAQYSKFYNTEFLENVS